MKLQSYLNKSLELQQEAEQQDRIDNTLVSLFHGKPFYCQWPPVASAKAITTDAITTNPYDVDRDTSTIKIEGFYTQEKYPNSSDNINQIDCCFNHIIGLPIKEGREYPLFDYEQDIINILENNSNPDSIKHKHLWIKKATGLGVSELILRYIAWLCLRDNRLAYSQISLVTGPRIELATTLVDRMKSLFERNNIVNSFDTKSTVLYLNKVRIEAYPSHHCASMRGQQNVSLVFMDEADFFPPGQQIEARTVSERYIGKSNPHIIMVSTPGQPEGLFFNIENEPEDKCIYRRIKLDYQVGLGKIYTQEDITKARASPSFNQEYCLHYGGSIGNIFRQQDIDKALDRTYSLEPRSTTPKIVSIDAAFGSSDLGIIVAEWRDQRLNILYEASISRPTFSQSIELVQSLLAKYSGIKKVLVDGSQPGFIAELKARYKDQYTHYHKMKPEVQDSLIHTSIPLIVAINWARHRKSMLERTYTALSKGIFRINEVSCPKLVTALRTATTTPNDQDYAKDKTSYSDVLDALLQVSLVLQSK